MTCNLKFKQSITVYYCAYEASHNSDDKVSEMQVAFLVVSDLQV